MPCGSGDHDKQGQQLGFQSTATYKFNIFKHELRDGKKMDQENEMSNHLENQRTSLTWNKKNCRQVPNSLPACE